MTEEQFRRLLKLAEVYVKEAERCAEIRCHHAACVMVGAALEAGLLAAACVFEEELRTAGAGPTGKTPLGWTLDQLINVAITMGWLPSRLGEGTEGLDPFEHGEVGDVVEFVQYVRNLAAHPGRHIRDTPKLPRLGEAAYANAYGVMRVAFDSLYQVTAKAVVEAQEDKGGG